MKSVDVFISQRQVLVSADGFSDGESQSGRVFLVGRVVESREDAFAVERLPAAAVGDTEPVFLQNDSDGSVRVVVGVGIFDKTL